MSNTLNILRIDASGRRGASSSRALADDLVAALEARYGDVEMVRRDLAESLQGRRIEVERSGEEGPALVIV